MPEAKPGKPPAALSRLGFLQRLAVAAGALGLGLLSWPRLPRPTAGSEGPEPSPRPPATPSLTPPAQSVKRRG